MSASGNSSTGTPSAMVLWMLLLTFIWGLAALSAKVITTGIAPGMAAGLRGGLAFAVLSAFVLVRPRVIKAPLRPVLLAVATGVMLATDFLFYFLGARLTTSGQLSVFVNTSPIFVAIAAHFLLPNDRLHRFKIAGVAVCFAGVVVLFSADLLSAGGGHWVGNLLVMGSALSWGASTLVIKAFLSDKLSAFQLLYFRLLVSFPVLLLFSWVTEPLPFHGVTPVIAALMIFQAVVVIVFSYMMWLWLLKQYPASALHTLAVMSPVWAVALGVVLLGESVTLSMALGMLLVGIGLVLVNRPAPKPPTLTASSR